MNEYFNQALTTLKRWISIKSVKDTAQAGAPFGAGIKTMLQSALSDAKSLGFEVKNYDGYVGEVIYGDGDDSEGIAVLCHIDVVPEGDLSKWSVPPYQATEKDGYLYGRGVVDDKGALAVCLYALKNLKDEGFIPSKKIKLILGCDEESGWGCIDHYNKVAVMPKMGFSPDGDFPVLYAEKGIYHVKFSFDVSDKVQDIKGGERINVVCDKVSVIFDDKTYGFEGVSAHGSTPELGDNAIDKALKFLVLNGAFSEQEYEHLFNGKLFSLIKDESGKLTFSPNIIKKVGNKVEISVDIRYPVHYRLSEIDKILKTIGEYEILDHKEPLYVSKDSEFVKTLNSVYEKHTGKVAVSKTTGGGTYARALKLGVAFGPVFDGGAVCHVPDEKLKVSDLEKCFYIYKDAIRELSK